MGGAEQVGHHGTFHPAQGIGAPGQEQGVEEVHQPDRVAALRERGGEPAVAVLEAVVGGEPEQRARAVTEALHRDLLAVPHGHRHGGGADRIAGGLCPGGPAQGPEQEEHHSGAKSGGHGLPRRTGGRSGPRGRGAAARAGRSCHHCPRVTPDPMGQGSGREPAPAAAGDAAAAALRNAPDSSRGTAELMAICPRFVMPGPSKRLKIGLRRVCFSWRRTPGRKNRVAWLPASTEGPCAHDLICRARRGSRPEQASVSSAVRWSPG